MQLCTSGFQGSFAPVNMCVASALHQQACVQLCACSFGHSFAQSTAVAQQTKAKQAAEPLQDPEAHTVPHHATTSHLHIGRLALAALQQHLGCHVRQSAMPH